MHQHRHKTFNLKFILPADVRGQWRHITYGSGQEMTVLIWGLFHDKELKPNTAWMIRSWRPSSPETQDGKNSIKWFLMIFCCSHRSRPSLIVIRQASWGIDVSDGNRCRDAQPTLDKERTQIKDLHWIPPWMFNEPCVRGKGRIVGVRGLRILGEHGPQDQLRSLTDTGAVSTEPAWIWARSFTHTLWLLAC